MATRSPFDLASVLRSPNPQFEDDLTVRGRVAGGGSATQPDTDPRTAYGNRLRALVSARDWMGNNPLSMNAGPESTGYASSKDSAWDWMRLQQAIPALTAASQGRAPQMPVARTQAPPSFETDWLRSNAASAATSAAQDAVRQNYVDTGNSLNRALDQGDIDLPTHAALSSRLRALGSTYGKAY